MSIGPAYNLLLQEVGDEVADDRVERYDFVRPLKSGWTPKASDAAPEFICCCAREAHGYNSAIIVNRLRAVSDRPETVSGDRGLA